MEIIRFIVHYGSHYILPFAIAAIFYRKDFWKVSLLLLLTNLIDLDHLLANPVFDPNRCSIGYHPLHSIVAILFYLLILVFPKSRILGMGFLLHIGIDATDCIWI